MRRKAKDRVASSHVNYELRLVAVMTHAEIGAVLGCSRARVQQIEKSALKKMRSWLEGWR